VGDSGSCRPIPSTDGTAHPGPQPAGTVFKLAATYKGKIYRSSLTWNGTVHAVTRPVLDGSARYGAVVTATPAGWAGGWATDADQIGIEACRHPDATGCVMLSGDELECSADGCGSRGGPDGPAQRPGRARVGNWYTGWYLFALDARLGNTISLLVGYPSPQAVPPWPKNATVARSDPVGPITGPPAPRIRFLSRARVHGRHVVVAAARCAVPCHVSTTVYRTKLVANQTTGWYGRQEVTGTASIDVTGKIPPGRHTVEIDINGAPSLRSRIVVP
jgi:hypothetical protein